MLYFNYVCVKAINETFYKKMKTFHENSVIKVFGMCIINILSKRFISV